HLPGVRGDGHEMLRHRLDVAAEALEQPLASALSVGHRLQRREGLRRGDEERLRRVQVTRRLHEIGPVHVRHETKGHRAIAVVPERFVGHHRAEIRAANADVDDVADALTRMALPFAAPHPVRELGHGVEDGVDLGHDVLAVHDDRRATRSAQGDVQDGPIFGHVDLVAPEHGVDALPEATLRGQSTEQRDGLVGDPILGVVEIDPGRLRGEALTTAWVLGEQRAEVTLRDLLLVILERLPRLARGQRQDSHHRLLPYFRRGRSIVRLLPQAETSGEGIYVVAGAAARRQRLELVNVAGPEDDVLWLELGDEACADVLYVLRPITAPMRLQPVQSDVLLNVPSRYGR